MDKLNHEKNNIMLQKSNFTNIFFYKMNLITKIKNNVT
jgi:hypothetical protein